MPAGRIVLKSISESYKLSKLKTDGARLLYTWLLTHLDINGCFSGDPQVIKGKVFTRLNKTIKTIEKYLKDLESNKLIIRYKVKGDIFLNIPDFVEKQPSLNPNREAKPNIPLPSPELLKSYSRVNQTQVKESKVKESKVKIRFLDFVFLTDEEHKKLLDKLGKKRTEDMIERLNNYIGSHGKKYKSHYFTILVWDKKDPDKKPIIKTKFFKAEDEDKSKFVKMPLEVKEKWEKSLGIIEGKKKVFSG